MDLTLTRQPSVSKSLFDLLPNLKRASKTEYFSPCPFCGGTDRFRVWPERGRWWCRQCGRRGDAIQLLRERDRLTFPEANRVVSGERPLPTPAQRSATVHSIALKRAKIAYLVWRDKTHLSLCNQRRVLEVERDIAAMAYETIQKYPELLTPDEQDSWTERLATLYDKLAAIDTHLDLLTLDEEQHNSFNWWRAEEDGYHV